MVIEFGEIKFRQDDHRSGLALEAGNGIYKQWALGPEGLAHRIEVAGEAFECQTRKRCAREERRGLPSLGAQKYDVIGGYALGKNLPDDVFGGAYAIGIIFGPHMKTRPCTVERGARHDRRRGQAQRIDALHDVSRAAKIVFAAQRDGVLPIDSGGGAHLLVMVPQ